MTKKSSVLTGTAGVYFVASRLAIHGFHAAVTYGNAPHVDILVSLPDGSATLSLQVKASECALRTRGRGENKEPHHYEWDVGMKSAKLHHLGLFYAFVNLKVGTEQLPDIFFVPSKRVFDWFKKLIEERLKGDERKLKRWRYHPGVGTIQRFRNNWQLLRDYLYSK